MNELFKCKCVKCGIEKQYDTDTEIQEGKFSIQYGITKAFLDGWNIGRNSECWDCQQLSESKETVKRQFTSVIDL
jgi:hypothetical protein